MAEANWLIHGVRIGRFEFRRTIRALRRDSARLVLTGVGVVLPGVALGAVIVLLASVLGPVTEPIEVPAPVRGSVGVFWCFGAFLVTQRTISGNARIDEAAMVLTTVSTRSVITGLVLAETLRALAYLAIPAITLTGVSLLVFGWIASLLFVPLAVGCFALTIALFGTALGIGLALVAARSPFIARYRTVLGGGATLAAFAAYLLAFGVGGEVDTAALAGLPVSWFVDLATIGSPLTGSPMRAGAIVAGTIGLGGAVLTGVERFATALWFDEPVSIDSQGHEATGAHATDAGTREGERRVPAGSDRLEVALGRFDRPLWIASGPARQVARMAVLRTCRAPRRLSFLVTPLAVVAISVGNVVGQFGSEALGPFVAFACALFGPWLAGATFGLNPLGEEGAVLPTTLLAVAPRAYVQGVMTPGIAFGLPVVSVLVLGGGVAVGYAPGAIAGLFAISLGLASIAIAVAPAIGLWLPRFSAISVGRSREVLPPGLLTVACYSVVVVTIGLVTVGGWLAPIAMRAVLLGVCAVVPAAVFDWLAGVGLPVAGVGAWFGGLTGPIGALSPGVVRFGVPTGVLLVGFCVAGWAYRNAIARFERYTIAT
jgi:ABC-2 type transport system permease protein